MKNTPSLLLKKAKLLGEVNTYQKVITDKAKGEIKNYPHKAISRCFEI